MKVILCQNKTMNGTVIIPKDLARQDDLVVMPRREYEELLKLKKIREFTPTKAQKKALARAESNLQRGKTLSYYELVRKLGLAD